MKRTNPPRTAVLSLPAGRLRQPARGKFRSVRLRATLLAALAVVLLAVPATGHAKRHGVQRNYAGARWAPSPDSFGWMATLRLDHALAVDRRSGGFIAETLWSTTNN